MMICFMKCVEDVVVRLYLLPRHAIVDLGEVLRLDNNWGKVEWAAERGSFGIIIIESPTLQNGI
jgi:hypothetical protein